MARDFCSLLEEVRRNRDHGTRTYKSVPAGDHHMSIQGSGTHYSKPREMLDDPRGYSKMEVALVRDGKWVRPCEIPGCPGAEYWEDGENGVGGYVPVDVIQAIYEHLCGDEGEP